jgi:hypothetical protein
MDSFTIHLIFDVLLTVGSLFLAFANFYLHNRNRMLYEHNHTLENELKDKELIILALTKHVESNQSKEISENSDTPTIDSNTI